MQFYTQSINGDTLMFHSGSEHVPAVVRAMGRSSQPLDYVGLCFCMRHGVKVDFRPHASDRSSTNKGVIINAIERESGSGTTWNIRTTDGTYFWREDDTRREFYVSPVGQELDVKA